MEHFTPLLVESTTITIIALLLFRTKRGTVSEKMVRYNIIQLGLDQGSGQ